MKQSFKFGYFLLQAVALVFALFSAGCDPFFGDGVTDPASVAAKGYLYITERESNSVIMMDYNMQELKKWSLHYLAPDTSIQGVTFDGRYLWLSFAGSVDRIIKVSLEGDTLSQVSAFDAPPSKQGTIRGITYDGTNLWAVNSGSSTYNNPPTLYKLNPANGAVLQSFPLPTPEPRGLAYITPKLDVYGRGIAPGLYYTDVAKKKVYYFSTERYYFDSSFTTPVPPMGIYNIYPTGISSDGREFFLINSSDRADHLYRLDYLGREVSRNDFRYNYPQSLVWSLYDVRGGLPPSLTSISPAKGAKGQNLAVDLTGSGFKRGATINFGANIHVDTTVYINSMTLHAYIRIDSAAALGLRAVTITNPDAVTTTLANGFEVTAAPVEEYIFWLDQNYSRVYQLRIKDSTTVGYWSSGSISTGSPQGIAFDGTNFWVTCSGTDKKMYKVTMPAGDTALALATAPNVIALPQYSSTFRGSTYSNGFFWQAASGSKIYRLDPSSGTILDSLTAPSAEPRGVSFIGNLLYCVDNTNKTLAEYTFTTSSWRVAFTIPSPAGSQFPTGLSYDGSSFWIANSTLTNDHVMKLTAAGQALLTINVTRSAGIVYDPSVTGIVYLAK